MKYLVVPLLLLSLSACHFDPSTAAPQSDAGDAALADCSDFVSTACGDCGKEVCIDSPTGATILCEPDPAAPDCEGNLSCNSEGYCAAQIACSSDTYRVCGECGLELCEDGKWSGECVANEAACEIGTNCLPSDMPELACQEACSTEGHQTPYDDSDFGQNNGNGGGTGNGNGSDWPFHSGPIPDIIALGEDWISIDGCEYLGEFRRCSCVIPYGSDDPTVECDDYCRDYDF